MMSDDFIGGYTETTQGIIAPMSARFSKKRALSSYLHDTAYLHNGRPWFIIGD